MFICKECGCEYKEKPDYCDCGNDTFEEIAPAVAEKPIKKQNFNFDKKELLSWIIFGVCLILSVWVLICFPKIKEKPIENSQEKPVNIVKTANQNIPSIDTFWINNKPVEPEITEEAPSPVQQIKEIFVKPKQDKQNTEKVSSKNQTTKTNKKVTSQTQQQKPQQQTTVQQKNKDSVKINTQKPQQSTPARSNMYEMLNYKNKLLNTLKNNLHFSEIQGSGECGIEFSINSSGKLINRNFTYQSDNKSVNDAIYHMLMRTAYVSAPPEGYKGEKLKIIFRISNTNYTIEYAK